MKFSTFKAAVENAARRTVITRPEVGTATREGTTTVVAYRAEVRGVTVTTYRRPGEPGPLVVVATPERKGFRVFRVATRMEGNALRAAACLLAATLSAFPEVRDLADLHEVVDAAFLHGEDATGWRSYPEAFTAPHAAVVGLRARWKDEIARYCDRADRRDERFAAAGR